MLRILEENFVKFCVFILRNSPKKYPIDFSEIPERKSGTKVQLKEECPRLRKEGWHFASFEELTALRDP